MAAPRHGVCGDYDNIADFLWYAVLVLRATTNPARHCVLLAFLCSDFYDYQLLFLSTELGED